MNDLDKLKIRKPGLIGPDRWNSLVSAVQSAMVTDFLGGTFERTDGGTILWTDESTESAASAPLPLPFQLSVTSGLTDPEDPESPVIPMVRVYPSTLAGGSSTDLGFSEGDDLPYMLPLADGKVVGGISFDPITLAITSRWLEIRADVPDADAASGLAYVEIGTASLTGQSVANSRYGPITASFCRDWYQSALNVYVTWA